MFSERTIRGIGPAAMVGILLAASSAFAAAAPGERDTVPQSSATESEQVPPLLLAGGRRLEFVRAIASERQLQPRRSFWKKLVDWVAGPPAYRGMVRPYGVALDSTGRLVVCDPGLPGVHVLDFEKQKYVLLEGGKGRAFRSPMGVAIDGKDNLYITDSQHALVFVFNSAGKFRRTIGGENGKALFQRPTGIAVDAAGKRLYVVDTLRHRIVTLDLDGNVLSSFGTRGAAPGQFNFPTGIAVRGPELLVVDAMNFRVQAFTREGAFLRSFGSPGQQAGTLFRPRGMAFDTEGNIYLADGLLEAVQVFDREGRLLYFFGRGGARLGEFQLPAGLFIDSRNRIYVADSLNQRVQVFQFKGPAQSAGGGAP